MGVNIRTIKDIRYYLSEELKAIYDDPEIASLTNIIIKTVFGYSRLHQLTLSEQTITTSQGRQVSGICEKLKSGMPIQYILGETFFYNCKIRLTSSTLIPRQETEELVDLIIRENNGYKQNIVDFGTGSGCIAIALAANLPGSSVTGIDISESAILVAGENALANNVTVDFMAGDILNFDRKMISEAGIFVSNPPYVRNSEKQLMSKNVLDFEPHTALFVSDSDPLVFYRAILEIARDVLSASGRLYFEINEALGNSMVQLIRPFGYSDIQIVKDLNGKERIVKAIKDA
jgi:release factor glutamine methyltransferase